MKDLQSEIGKLIETMGDVKRDAIHVAVAPVVAAHNMMPGDHVELVERGSSEVRAGENPIGIVDPFLKDKVKIGQSFYLFLYPRTTNNLRHEWEHPAFAEDKEMDSKKWLTSFASRHGFAYDGSAEQDYEEMMTQIEHYLSRGYITTEWSVELTDEFWDHVGNVRGFVNHSDRAGYLPCSC